MSSLVAEGTEVVEGLLVKAHVAPTVEDANVVPVEDNTGPIESTRTTN